MVTKIYFLQLSINICFNLYPIKMKKLFAFTLLLCLPFLGLANNKDNKKNDTATTSTMSTAASTDTGGTSSGGGGGYPPPEGSSTIVSDNNRPSWVDIMLAILLGS
jgi:uncharacterized membrane protein YgcG